MKLETERLILRGWEDKDRAPMAAIMGDKQVRRFYPRLLSPEQTSADIDAAILKAAANGYHMSAVELRETGETLGLAGIGKVPDAVRAAIPSHPEVEVGWVLGERYWGQGFAPEAAAAWLDYGFSVVGLDEIVAFTAAINLPSQRVMEKLGMVRDPADDYEHPAIEPGHRLRSHVLYRTRRKDWATPAAPR